MAFFIRVKLNLIMMLNRKLYYITIYISNLIYFAVVLCLSFGPWPFGITPIWLYLTRPRSLDLLLIASNLHRIALDHHVQASLNMHNIIRYRDACRGLSSSQMTDCRCMIHWKIIIWFFLVLAGVSAVHGDFQLLDDALENRIFSSIKCGQWHLWF